MSLITNNLFYRFNYHLEKVRDIVNNAFTSLLSFDDENFQSMEVDPPQAVEKSLNNESVDPRDQVMCKIVDEIKFST